jgi:hypothetical protein
MTFRLEPDDSLISRIHELELKTHGRCVVQCYCCGCDVAMARKVKLRVPRDYDPSLGGPNSAAYQSYMEETTYRWAVICQACYSTLDNAIGLADIAGKPFNLAAASRGDKAATVNEEEYRKFQHKEAKKLARVPEP